jgi:hypothetical protein
MILPPSVASWPVVELFGVPSFWPNKLVHSLVYSARVCKYALGVTLEVLQRLMIRTTFLQEATNGPMYGAFGT